MTSHTRMRSIFFMAALLAVIFLLGACASSKPEAVQAPDKIVVLSLDELPVHTYSIEGTVSQLVDDRPALKKLHAEYLADLKADLSKYEINDTATLQGKYRSLATMELIAGNNREAVKLLNQVADMEDKEASRLTSGMITKVLIQAKESLPENYTQAELQDSFVAHLSQYVNDLPYEVVQDNIKSGKGRAEYLSENLLRGVIQSQLDPAVAATGELSADQAGAVLGIRFTMDQMLALNPMVAKVYGDYLDKNMVEKENIWPAREFVFRDKMMRPEVLIGIWDSGVDSDVFRDIMFVNKNEKIDGTDTDGNGWVDDIHGIAFDLDGVYNTHLLHPLGDQEGKLDKVFGYMQGFTDLTSAIDSKAAGDVRKEMANMPPEKVGDFLTSLSFGGLYSHGTHVAGIACQDNPFARIMTARITFDYHNTPKAMTMETAQRMADGYRATTKYFSENQVRVVNMSWGWTFKEIEGSLEANGVGESAEERASMAREMIDVLSDGLYDSMADTPEILYISAAGNDDNDVEFDVVIPSNFELPNLVIVGAVDQAGDPTSFTSGGRNVRVYANGFQVESEVPGGGLMKMSGTSMASPNVCNLAGKILAVKPDLSPEAVVQLIEKNADPNQDHPNILLINPRKTIESIK